MSGDIAFDAKLNRTISVDAKYILFIIDKFAGATHLINEMTLVKSAPKRKETQAKEEVVERVEKIEKTPTLTFEQAFLNAWRIGEKTFSWNGAVYTTERADDRVISDIKE
jgi:hypothetical protein